MKFRTGLIVGFAAGYVLGSKAGRERYEQIRKVYGTIMGTAPMQKLVDDAKELADQSTTKMREVVSDQMQSVSEHVRHIADEKLGGGDGSRRADTS